MPPNNAQLIGSIETVPIRDVWRNEATHFTPWLESNVGELDKVLGLGLTNPRKEVGAGDFSIDLVAETNYGEIVIENQFGRSDHRHLGQLLTYLSQREVQRAIWIVEEGRPEHVKAVDTLNNRGVGQIWMITMKAIRIGDSAVAPLFTVVVAPSEGAIVHPTPDGSEPTPSEIQKRNFMAALFAQARNEGIASPFQHLTPNFSGLQQTSARGSGLLYRVAVNRRESRVVVTNAPGRWTAALNVLVAKRPAIDRAFADAGLSELKWPERVTARRWWIRYAVSTSYESKVDPVKMRELNVASAEMKRVFEPYLKGLDPQLE